MKEKLLMKTKSLIKATTGDEGNLKTLNQKHMQLEALMKAKEDLKKSL